MVRRYRGISSNHLWFVFIGLLNGCTASTIPDPGTGSAAEVLPAPTLLSPSTTPWRSAEETLVIEGTCAEGAVVTMSGAGDGTSSCVGGSFSLTFEPDADGTYDLAFTQGKAGGTASPAANLQWIRDTTAPAAPSVLEPATSPFVTTTDTLTIAGGC